MKKFAIYALALLATVILGVIVERCAYKPLRDAPKMSIMISAIGVSFLLENLATYLFSGVPKGFPALPALTRILKVGTISFPVVTFVIPTVTIILLIGLIFLVNHTKIGMAMRAVAKDYETASLMGIQINKIIGVSFSLGSLLAGVGAVLWGAKYPSVYPLMGVMPGLKCFIAAVLGGIGNIQGAMLGGFILGMGETFLIAFMPTMTGYRDAFAFILLIVILFIKPTGLLGEKIADKV